MADPFVDIHALPVAVVPVVSLNMPGLFLSVEFTTELPAPVPELVAISSLAVYAVATGFVNSPK